MSSKRGPGVTNLQDLPVILTVDHVARVYYKSPGAILRAVGRKTFLPRPFAKYPYRWLREDVIRDLARIAKLSQAAQKAGTR